MGFDVSRIDEQIKKLQEIRRMISDPETAALLEHLMKAPGAAPNGSGHGVALPAPERPPAAPKVRRGGRGTQTQAIRSAVSHMPQPFTVRMVADRVRAEGMRIENNVVGKILQRLLNRRQIRVVGKEPGFGGPNVYESALPPQ